MKKKSSFSTQGQREDIGELGIQRLLPNRYANAVGPFVLLDHILPNIQQKVSSEGTGAHPHRGIATLTYILNGEARHFDSAGHFAIVRSGGVQWMNAGNGIIHDETINHDPQTDSKLIHAFQFWINLPGIIKAEMPSYRSVQAEEVPVKTLADGKGWIKVVIGTYEDLSAVIPDYSEQFLYHVRLEPGSALVFEFSERTEVAAFLPLLPVMINDENFRGGDFAEFDREAGTIELRNGNPEACDILLFGGEPYTEPIFAEGPFVMNSKVDTAIAYRDYFNGDYGKIDYEQHSSLNNGQPPENADQ
ncbi:pirin family protein [Mucilaginibacter lutimaris]|uniref:Pirin family protein n=1 Tax=Mucilaginibacter lutimaris TaxID=931629 RepID=A0ABW2ZEC6_9SPHI